MTVMMMMMK